MSEEIGKFSLKFAGNTYTSESNGDVTIRQNWQGSGDGFGTVFGTLTFGPTPPSKLNSGGTIKWVGQAFHEDGTTVIGQGEGTWETPPDRHIAKTSLIINISDGTTIRSEGEMGLADLEWNGTMYST